MKQFDIMLKGEPIAFVMAKDEETVRKSIVIKRFRCKKGEARFGRPVVLD
jgi:hypothetical protein